MKMHLRVSVLLAMAGMVGMVAGPVLGAPPTKTQILRSIGGLQGGQATQLGPNLPTTQKPGILAGPAFKLLPLDWNKIIYLTVGQPVAAKQWPSPTEEFAALGLSNMNFGPADAMAAGSLADLAQVIPPTGAAQVLMGSANGNVILVLANPPLGKYAITVWVTGTGPGGLGLVVAKYQAPPLMTETTLATSLDGQNIGMVLPVERMGQYWVSVRSTRNTMWRVAGVSVMKLAG
jgi:hypothetical protein